MAAPFFYQSHISANDQTLILDEPTSKHCIQVLRMTKGEPIILTDGNGLKLWANIENPDKKHCSVTVEKKEILTQKTTELAIAIAFTKNKSRNEWFLEKATEIGIQHIYPIITEHSEKDKFNQERYQQIIISALIQSQQTFLPTLHQIQKLRTLIENINYEQKFIAHCISESEKTTLNSAFKAQQSALILIGPEGDFSEKEVAECLQHQFIPVSLGPNRLRTETAAIYATTLFNAFHYE